MDTVTEPGWIEELLKNNDPPSDVAAQEVKKLLLKPLKDLAEIDSEMLTLRERLLELESKRDKTKKQIIRYQSILAPIRRVFPEVLGEIFYHCLPTHRNPIMKSSECPLLLGRVCSTWRSTATSTPKLWDRLYITFTDADTMPDLESALEMVRNGQDDIWRIALPKADKERTAQLLRRRYEGVKEWFLRSGSRPISISLRFTAIGWNYPDRPPGAMAELLSFLASLAPRWKKFELDAPLEINQALEDRLPVSQMTTLNSFQVGSSGRYYEPSAESTRAFYLKLFDAPNLKQIAIWGNYAPICRDFYRSFKKWDKFTHISCCTLLSEDETILLFEHATNLVEYQGVIASGTMEDTPVVYDRLISLPFLQSLSIIEYICPQRVRIYDHINAPKLQHIKYNNDSDSHSNWPSFDNPTPFPILPLLLKSTKLETLSIQTLNLKFWDVGTLLRAIPSVTDLVIGAEGKPPHGIYSVAQRDRDSSGFLRKYPWSFNDLVVDSNSDTPLLPQLKSLTITSASVWTSDNILFDMIKSRMVPSTQTVALETVKAIFFREKERDIVEELWAHAESIGVKIKLDFEYAQKSPSISNPISPDFGLKEENNI